MRKSWDCFDTLLGRSYKDPKSIFYIVAQKIKDPSFPAKRINAEKRSRKKTYEDIYRLIPEYDPSIEFDTEKEHTFPIIENFKKIQDGDVVVSDMYFSSTQILELLNHHKLNKDIDIYVTYSGKHTGQSWNYLRNKYNDIQYHIGDNLKSDVHICRSNGFKSIFFGGNSFTPEEKEISKNNYALATLMRRTRLSNPFSRPYAIFYHSTGSFQNIAGHLWIEEINQNINYFTMYQYVPNDYMVLRRKSNDTVFIKITLSGECFLSTNGVDYARVYDDGKWVIEPEHDEHIDQKLWWIDQSQFNLPILALVCANLPDKKIAFCERDCYYLYQIYKALYPTKQDNVCMLDVSRKSYYTPFNNEYITYVLDTTKDRLIVDSHGSGSSANYFFNTKDSTFDLYHICKHPVKKGQKDNNSLVWSNFCERKFLCSGRFLEKYNINYKGPLIGWDGSAIRANSEHNKIICDTIQSCIDYICKHIHIYSIKPDNNIIPLLLSKLKGTFTEQTVNSIGA